MKEEDRESEFSEDRRSEFEEYLKRLKSELL